MRAAYQVLALPYRFKNSDIEYAILKRSDMGVWQGVAGGGEDGETILESVKRETFEEIGIDGSHKFIKLDTITSIPVIHFKNYREQWENIYVIPEYCYGVQVELEELKLSDEHKEFRWCNYDYACKLLQWDSNKTALWELNERLKKSNNSYV